MRQSNQVHVNDGLLETVFPSCSDHAKLQDSQLGSSVDQFLLDTQIASRIVAMYVAEDMVTGRPLIIYVLPGQSVIICRFRALSQEYGIAA